jgi:hypothetical protein
MSIGFLVFLVTKKTPPPAVSSMRWLFVFTNGRLNDAWAKASAIRRPARPVGASGVLGDLTERDVTEIAERLDADGYFLFDAKLDPATCEEIVRFARATPGQLTPRPDGGPEVALFDPDAPLAPRYEISEEAMLQNPTVQRLAVDPSFRAVAAAYLGCRPVNDLVAMWWSVPFGDAPSSEAAQLFHFDLDRPRFLKFFFYLTDVAAEQGPHCYVKGSHRHRPHSVLKDSRLSDTEITRAYPADDLIEVVGPRGTILAADTTGFHKGIPPVEGHRLMFQIEYANSLFGSEYNRISTDWADDVRETIEREPFAFQRFELAGS